MLGLSITPQTAAIAVGALILVWLALSKLWDAGVRASFPPSPAVDWDSHRTGSTDPVATPDHPEDVLGRFAHVIALDAALRRDGTPDADRRKLIDPLLLKILPADKAHLDSGPNPPSV